MIRRLPLRARLTLLVSVVFGAAVVVTSVVVLRSVEADLIADTEASAEALLADYLDSIYGGTASLGVIDATDTGRFFYLDAEGSELTPRQYFEMIVPALEIGGPVLAAGSVEVIGDVPFPDVVFDEVAGPIQVDPDLSLIHI